MKNTAALMRRLYTFLLKGYPPGFRAEFGEEMEEVFNSQVEEASAQGLLPVMMVLVRELVYLPASILTEIRHESWRRVMVMETGVQSTSPIRPPGTWRDALLAGSPHLIIAALVGLITLFADSPAGPVGTYIILFLLIGGFLASIFLTWRLHWPAWGASWYGYAALCILIFAVLPHQGWQAPISTFLNAIGSLVLLAIALFALFFWLSRRDPVEGLLIALPLVIVYWVPVMEFIQNNLRMWLVFALFLETALAAILILRANDVRKGVWVLVGASLLGGLPLTIARTWFHTIPVGHFLPPSLFEMFSRFSIQFLAGAALALGPIFGWGLWNLGRKLNLEGRISAGLIISGMVLNLLGQYNYWEWYSNTNYFDALGITFLFDPDREWSIFMIAAGWIAILAGGVWLAILTWKSDRLSGVARTLTALALPIFAMLPVYFGFRFPVPIFLYDMTALTVSTKTLIFTIGILLLIFCAWTVSRLPFEDPPRKASA